MTPDDEPLRGALPGDQVPGDLSMAPPQRSGPNDTPVIRDRRRPLRDLAGQQLQAMPLAERLSLVAYWASVAPAAFLLACEAFEQDTRW